MNITFDPLNRDERSVVLALLSNLEAPTTTSPAAQTAPAPEKPATRRKAKTTPAELAEAVGAALAPAPVDTSEKLQEVTKAIEAVAAPEPPPAPPVEPPAPEPEVKTLGEQLAQTQALTREDIRDLLSTYAAKGPEENRFATSLLKDCMFKLSLLQPEKYPEVAAAVAGKGWTLDQARAAVAATKAKG
jgi:hypothetical protein